MTSVVLVEFEELINTSSPPRKTWQQQMEAELNAALDALMSYLNVCFRQK